MVFNKVLDNLKLYEAGKPIELVVREYGVDEKDIIKLASNENPYGCSPKVLEAIQKEAKKANLYPDDSMYELKDGLAKKYDVKSENVIIGLGSDEVISLALHAKANENNAILMAKTTFAMYEIYGRQTGTKILKTPSGMHKLEEFLELYKQNPEIAVIFLCIPNNPLGECLDIKSVYTFLDQIDKETLVIIDGAYEEFAAFKDPENAIDVKDITRKYENVLYLGTFSKAYGLGGMRCGYGIANENIIKALYKLRPPFNITTLTLKAAIVALKDQEFVKNTIEQNFKEMKRYEEFALKNNLEFIPSYTNFITIKYDETKNSSDVAQKLLKKGIIIRDLASYSMNAIRITIGTPEQNSRFFNIYQSM